MWPELNGVFLRIRDFDQLSPHERPIYVRHVMMDSKEMRVLCFFWNFAQSGQKKASIGVVFGEFGETRRGEGRVLRVSVFAWTPRLSGFQLSEYY